MPLTSPKKSVLSVRDLQGASSLHITLAHWTMFNFKTSCDATKLRINRETDEYEAFFCKYIILHSRGQTSK